MKSTHAIVNNKNKLSPRFVCALIRKQKKLMPCTSHVSHPFNLVHVLFCYVVLREKSRNIQNKKSFLLHILAATQRGQRLSQGTRLLYSNFASTRSARVRIRRVLNGHLNACSYSESLRPTLLCQDHAILCSLYNTVFQ